MKKHRNSGVVSKPSDHHHHQRRQNSVISSGMAAGGEELGNAQWAWHARNHVWRA